MTAKIEENPVVLVVDDTIENILLINEILKNKYSVRVATDGFKAVQIAEKSVPDIILMDVMMPGMDGYETCKRIKENIKLKDIPLLFLTAKADVAAEQKGFDVGAADYITKPINPPILMARINTHLMLKQANDILKDRNKFLNDEVQRRTEDISVLQEASIMAMASLAETRDTETGHHLRRTRLYIRELAEHMGKIGKYAKELTPGNIKKIVISSPLHDIGKIGIPDSILLKPGPLSEEECEIMKRHTILGKEAIESAEKIIGAEKTFLTCARQIAYSHHEKWDGSGYPQGLVEEEIPLPARLMAVVDAYDALTSKRVYKKAVSHKEAVSIIEADSGKHFDPDVVCSFLFLADVFRRISEKHRNIIALNLNRQFT